MPTEKHILVKYRARPPSLIVHLHPTYFRFDQQDGSFSYQSEMRIFIEHLQKKTIPHDMLEEFRKSDVKFYEGWLIVKVVDHKTAAADASGANGAADDEKPFSIHNYNHFITPSPCVPYPSKEQQTSPVKQERSGSVADKDGPANGIKSDENTANAIKPARPQSKEFFVALRPTNLSKHMDLLLDCTAPDPKAKKAQNKTIAQPPTPIGTVPPTPTTDRPPPPKKQKLRIDPKDHLEYEAKIVNGTAPPLYLEPAQDLDDAERIHKLLADPWCNEPPPSPRSRKRTVAELAADDAHAKEQERFMLIMDARGSGTGTAANAGGVDPQAGNAAFQPRFEKFNALDNIKREIVEKKQREKDRQLQEDELRRSQQQQNQEEEKRRQAQQAMIAQRKEQAIRQQQQAAQMQQRQNQEAMAQAQQQQQNPQNAQRPSTASRPQPNGIPPQMQTQMMAQASSPIVRQGTPNIASSPAAGNPRPMVRNGSQSGAAGSPGRPGSSLQHGHPAASGMMRQPSGQGGPSRNGTPQIPHSTPGMNHATPIIRQGTPGHALTQASPVPSIAMVTPQMGTVNMQGQMTGGMPQQGMSAQQYATLQRRQQMQNHMAMQQINGGMNANPQQVAQAHHQAQAQAAMQRQMQGTPQQQHASMSPAPNPQQQHQYNEALKAHMQKQMAHIRGGQTGAGSPVPVNQMSPQQMQQLQMMQQQHQMQNQQQGQNSQGQLQQRPVMNPQVQQLCLQYFKQMMLTEAPKYGGNVQLIPPNVKQQLQAAAQKQAMMMMQQRQKMAQQNAAMMAQQQQQGGQMHPNMGNMGNMSNMGNMGGQMGGMGNMGNMNAAMMQQQQSMNNMNMQNAQARQMQQMQIQNAQQQMAQAQYQQQMAQMQQQMMNPQGQGQGQR